MRVAFLIRRDNHYRLLGPAIDRALARGWDVECWHAVDEGLKGARALERRNSGWRWGCRTRYSDNWPV